MSNVRPSKSKQPLRTSNVEAEHQFPTIYLHWNLLTPSLGINASLKRQVLEAEMRATLLMDLVRSGVPILGTPMSVNPSHQLPDVDGINKGIKMVRRKSTFFTCGSFNKTNGFSKTQHHTRGPPQEWHHPHTQATRLQAILLPTLTTTVRGNNTGASPQKADRMNKQKF